MSPVTERPTVNLGERLKAPTHSPSSQNSKDVSLACDRDHIVSRSHDPSLTVLFSGRWGELTGHFESVGIILCYPVF